MAMQIVDFKTLPKNVLSQIPFSLKVSKDKHIINELPVKVQYLIRQYLEKTEPIINYDDVYDMTPTMSVYNDLTPIKDVKQLILEYLKNYFLISLGSYPFDVNFGSYLKQQLHTKDTSLRNKLLSTELTLICEVLSVDYNTKINIKSFKIDKVDVAFQSHVEYTMELYIQIDDDTFVIKI